MTKHLQIQVHVWQFVFAFLESKEQFYSLNKNVMPSSPGFFSTVQRKVTVTIHHKQYKHCREWEQEVLETFKLEANGPELYEGKSH